MFSRVAGAGLALIAAALLALSAAPPVLVPGELALFAGHPTVNQRTRETQEMHIGLFRAELCNTGGDGTCRSGDTRVAYRVLGYGALAATGIVMIGLILLAALALVNNVRRKRFARVVQVVSVVVLGAVGAMLAIGPFSEASVPYGLGGPLFGAGILVGLIASFVAPRQASPIKLRVADHLRNQPPAPQPFAPVSDSQRRGQPQPFVPAPDSQRPAPQLPFAAPTEAPRRAHRISEQGWPAQRAQEPPAWPEPQPQPHDHPGAPHSMFSPEQQQNQRPLYDAAPHHGGTGGLILERQSDRVIAAPVPAPRTTFGSSDDLPTPPPFVEHPPLREMQPVFGRGKPATNAPPIAAAAQEPSSPFASTLPGMPPGVAPAAPRTELPPPMPAAQQLFGSAMPAALPLFGSATPAAPQGWPVASEPAVPHGWPTLSEPSAAQDWSPAPTELTSEPTTSSAQLSWPSTETPLAPPPMPVGPPPPPQPGTSGPIIWPGAETPLAPPPLPVAPARKRETVPPPLPPPTPPPPSRAAHDSQPPPGPRTAVRAAVPMPARPARATASPTRPPPAPPLPAGPRPKGPTSGPATPFVIPPIPAIRPIPAIPTAPPPLPPRSETETETEAEGLTQPEPRIGTLSEAGLTPAPEFGDITSTSNVAFGGATADEMSPIDAAAARKPDPADTAPTGEPMARTSDLNGAHVASLAMDATRPAPKLPISTAPDSLPPPKDSKEQNGPSPACPQCESPMAWVEEHLRFYCKSCRMYF